MALSPGANVGIAITQAGRDLLLGDTPAEQRTTLGLGAVALLTLAEVAAAVEEGFTIENRTSDPVAPVSGQIWLRTDL